MSKKSIVIGAVLAIVTVVVLVIIFGGKTSAPSTNSAASVQTQTPQTNESLQVLTVSEVAKHATASDCWTIVNGSVYDITSYVPRHPGGDEILLACGTDGTTLFTKRETSTGQTVGSGTPHSSTAQNQLSALKIGTVSQ